MELCFVTVFVNTFSSAAVVGISLFHHGLIHDLSCSLIAALRLGCGGKAIVRLRIAKMFDSLRKHQGSVSGHRISD